MYRSKRARQACGTSWKPAEHYMQIQKVSAGEHSPQHKPTREKGYDPKYKSMDSPHAGKIEIKKPRGTCSH
jgi:hypothetical protein